MKFECLGYFEDLVDVETTRCYGTRPVKSPDRPCGFEGRREIVLTANTTVDRGAKQAVIKASPDKPVKVWATLQILCGKVIK